MTNNITSGSQILWSVLSPCKTGKISDEFNAFLDEMLIPVSDEAFIKGIVMSIIDGSAIVQVSDMSSILFPFTLFFQ